MNHTPTPTVTPTRTALPAGIRVVPADRVVPDMTPGQWAWTCAARSCRKRPTGQFHGLAGYPSRDDAIRAAAAHLTKTRSAR